jgi:xyloglucan-specific exo-beta-1,4-glucanase
MRRSRILLSVFCVSLVISKNVPAAAESYNWGNVSFEGGGFVSGIFPSKTQAGLVYARTDVGGAYRWDSTGGHWIPLMDNISQVNVGLYGTEALALDPQDSRRVYILAGTSYFSNGKTMIFRSSDYGKTFDTVNVTTLFQAHGNGDGRQTGEKLAVDPQNSSIIFCGSRTKGLFKSIDTGKTWTSVLGTTDMSGSSVTSDNGISFVLFDPSSGKTAAGGTKTIYLGVCKSPNNLYVSNDGGDSFTPVAGSPSNMMAMRAALSQGKLYITFSSGPGPYNVSNGSVWKYSISASTWTNITPKDSVYYGSGSPGKASGFGGISVDPTDPKHLVVSTINSYASQYRWANKKDNAGDVIFESTDDGATWRNLLPAWITNDGTNPNCDPDGNAWIDGSAIHWAGCIEFDPFNPKRVWVISGNGIFRTDNISATNPLWKFQSRGLEETVPLDIVSVPGGPLVTAIGDYDGARYSNNNIYTTAPVHEPRIGTTVSLGYGPLNGTFVRAGHVTDYSTQPATESDVLYYSTDTAKTWTKLPTPKAGKGYTVLNADGSVILHRAESGNTFYRSKDKSKTWTTVTGLDGQANYSRIIPDPVDPAVFYLLDQQGNFLTSSDSGATFVKLSKIYDDQKGLWQNSTSMMRAVPGKKGHLWIPLDQCQQWQPGGYSRNGLALTEDGGKTFERFPAVNVCVSVGLGKAASGTDYFALYIWGAANNGPVGIYRSIDKGATWERINDDSYQFGGPGNGNFIAGDFNVYGRVYMSTVGRGLIYGEPVGTIPVKTGIKRGFMPNQLYRKGNFLISNNRTGIFLIDLKGRQIRKSQIVNGKSLVDLTGLRYGIYVAKAGTKATKINIAR